MNTGRPFSPYAPPGSGQVTQGSPAAPARSNGEGGRVAIPPLKVSNPATFLRPWLIIPLGIATWGLIGFAGAFVLHWLGA